MCAEHALSGMRRLLLHPWASHKTNNSPPDKHDR